MKKEMLINVLQPEECRIAIVEDGVLEELYVERTSHESYTGNIYQGKVVNLEPAIQAAFVDFSVGRNGFLHVSDVEPQYYNRHQLDEPEPGPRRDRESRGRGRAPEDRDASPAPPPAWGEEQRPRERERPDRSERGRVDRSRPRRFGEGLTDDDASPPPPPPTRAEPVQAERAEPIRSRTEPTAPPASSPAWPDEAPRPPRPPAREPRAAEPGESRVRTPRSAEPFDPDLPPSRTNRTRPTPPTARPPAQGPEEAELPSFAPATPAIEPDPPAVQEPRRGRGRGRPTRSPEPEPTLEAEVEPEPPVEDAAIEPSTEDRPEPSSRRRGGRAAIRSRGGDREPRPERPREPAPERPREPAPERPREPVSDRPRSLSAERAPAVDLEPIRSPEPDRPRERVRIPERPRVAEPDAPRERSRPHGRAGEPGYVPRRERSRDPETSFGAGIVPSTPPGRPEMVPELESDVEPESEGLADESTSAADKIDGTRRRRRRRGRRRERERPESDPVAASSAEDTDADFEDEELEPAPLAVLDDESPLVAVEADLRGDFDFGDEADVDEVDVDEDEDEAEDDEPFEERGLASADDEIDPELEEEIRREVEEIAELEREMGLRGPSDARPRRGDDRDAEPGRPGPRSPRGRGMVKPPIQECLRRGDEVLVQVIKESIGTKGPTLSTYISIPGRYLVLMPGLNRVGVSRKIADESQRRKLREIMNDLNPPKGLGFIVRTAGLERTKRELARDLAYLLRLWKVILLRIKRAKSPAPIYQESDMITRTIRDIFTAEIDTIWIDEPAAFQRAQEFLRVVMPKFVDRLKLYDEKAPLFHKYGIEDEIAKIQRRHVPLRDGGSIVIDQTEALVAIDVNSGNFRFENDAERTAYEMNLRAAKEIARQLRLRDLGGVIVNDFIDMRDERHRRGVEKALRDAIKRDRARSKVLSMSAFGLIEMTRQRIRPSLKRSVYEDCSHCSGGGVVKTVESMSIDVMRLLALASHRTDIRRVNVGVCGAVATFLNNRKRPEIARLEAEANLTVHIRPEDDAPAEHLQLECFDANNSEIRLLPAPVPSHRRGR